MARKTLRLALVAGELLQHKRLAKALQPFHVREREVLQFVQDIRPTDWHCDVVIIPDITRDPIGPARTLRDFDCLVVTTETAKGGVVVNEARKEAGCPEVAIVEVALRSQGSQHGGKVSSTDVREYMSDKAGGEEALNAMYDKWSQLIAKACAVDGVVDDDKHEQLQLKIDEWWSTLRDLYLQPWRYYHTLNHVGEILGNIESSCVGEGPLPITVASSAHATTTLQLTAWFHDAIYVPGLDGNEDASQQLWLKFCLDAAVASELRDEVSDIILATKDHVSSRSIYPEEAYPTLNAFLDLDLLILAADEDRYREYAEGIRQEYEPVVGGSSIYAQQRCGFLASVCNSKRAMFAFCGGPSEAQARSNMEMELKRLQLQ
ncbi:conserved hypothetical protein [Perkinsus marinus ATCC 50983]|uniref:Uncharacterized protein n=1 Tax=Perkinsus marinus (strain ATCC 50983 / TXsc) TaxID=423536 RepID=C5KE97_PERM5|nr:conserved hypothetical protein [Perkinsus marinus ATCC 50983]EER17195.1 conserved hypothetical protein [Perkinsus marinus ATCC 50983]|eukprot:XP_002785399.1 conserved hypothetical protein [Perkinsus marinus ATCC 50983]